MRVLSHVKYVWRVARSRRKVATVQILLRWLSGPKQQKIHYGDDGAAVAFATSLCLQMGLPCMYVTPPAYTHNARVRNNFIAVSGYKNI